MTELDHASVKKIYEEAQEESPRGSVIVWAALLDTRLRELISNFMIDDKAVENLLGTDKDPDRPLSSFASRARIAYCLGLISFNEYDDLKTIATIRNKFAHRVHSITTENDKEIVDLCKKLKTAKVLIPYIFRPTDIVKPMDSFISAVIFLDMHLGLYTRDIKKHRRQIKL